jgi:tRNA-5-methyluridine54 2-sulfurtransferase
MKCRKCDLKAVINMRQHKLGLCKQHFLEWIPDQVERFIHKYAMFNHSDKILIAISGGKDSLSLWDILWRLGYKVDGLYIDLGIDEGIQYSDQSKRLTEEFANERNLSLRIVDFKQEYGETIPVVAARTKRGKEKPCAVCGLAKRHVMNRIARQYGYDVLATGHNLDDEVSVLFGNTLNWLSDYLVRQSPVLEADRSGLVKKVKPLCRIYEREMAAYALLRGINYIHDECPFVSGSNTIYYKEIFNQIETERPGAKLAFYISYLKAKEDGLFSDKKEMVEEKIHSCPSCGQPTTTPGECAFCRMMNTSMKKK